jgi:hypothetical protein
MRNPPDARQFVEVLAPALREAAAIARALEGRVRNRPKLGEATPVKAALTAADTACQETLLAALHGLLPDARLEAEEDTPSVASFSGRGDATVVIDPIDGTLRFFLEGLGPYASMVGLALGGVYRAALVALPREGLLLDAVRGEGARIWRGDRPARPARVARRGHRILISHDLPGPAVEVLLAAGFAVQPACGGAIAVAPLLPGVRGGLRFAADGGVSARARVGALIAVEAGALVLGEDGAPFPDEVRAPASALLVAAHEDDLAVLRDAVAAARRSLHISV